MSLGQNLEQARDSNWTTESRNSAKWANLPKEITNSCEVHISRHTLDDSAVTLTLGSKLPFSTQHQQRSEREKRQALPLVQFTAATT